MRSYGCHIFYYKDKEFTKVGNTACFAGLSYNGEFEKKDIYIDEFKEPEVTDKQRERLITLINRITPCEIVTIDKKEYIKFRMLHSYDSSLILLNMIRMMWCEFKKEFDTKLFFEDLMIKGAKGQDALEKIMSSHNKAVTLNTNFRPGHSNINPKNSLKIKKKKALLEYEGSSTSEFMTK